MVKLVDNMVGRDEFKFGKQQFTRDKKDLLSVKILKLRGSDITHVAMSIK